MWIEQVQDYNLNTNNPSNSLSDDPFASDEDDDDYGMDCENGHDEVTACVCPVII